LKHFYFKLRVCSDEKLGVGSETTINKSVRHFQREDAVGERRD